jgi:hypothetical protein
MDYMPLYRRRWQCSFPEMCIPVYAMHCFSLVDILPLKSMFFSIVSITVLNMVADSGSPYSSPDSTVNSSLKLLFTLILTLLFVKDSAVSLINFNGTLYCLRLVSSY